jgi:hypothetical protein
MILKFNMKGEIEMIYKCEDRYLTAILLTFKGFSLKEKQNDLFIIEYEDKNKLLRHLEKYVNNSLTVDLIKLKEKQAYINNL